MRIAFRVDASLDIGTGHVMRCLTLAKKLKLLSHECVFISRPHQGNLIDYIVSCGFEVKPLSQVNDELIYEDMDLVHAHWLGSSWSEDAEQTIQSLKDNQFDCIVVDHYSLDIRWESVLKKHIKHVFVIDDLADRRHDCSGLLDQNFGRFDSDYKPLLLEGTKTFIGPQYALLRDEFLECRFSSINRRKGFKLNQILVNLGGVDLPNYTYQILEALNKISLGDNVKVVVVLGGACPHEEIIKTQIKTLTLNVELFVGVSDMALLMASSDLAIGAAGSTTWERFALGLPSVLVCVAENQRSALLALQKEGYIKTLDEKNFSISLKDIFGSDDFEMDMLNISKQSLSLCDALGAQKIAEAIGGLCDS